MHGLSLGTAGMFRAWGQAPERPGGECGFLQRRGHEHDSRHGNRTDPAVSLQDKTLLGFDSAVSTLRTRLDSLATSVGFPENALQGANTVYMGARLVSREHGELQIHTQEGDVVTLKFSNKTGGAVAARQSSDSQAMLSEASVAVHSRSRIAVQVAGDLNDAELAAVTELVDKIGALSEEFFAGNLETVLNRALSLSYDTSQLADYSLDLSLKQSVRAFAYEVRPMAAQPSSVASNGASASNSVASSEPADAPGGTAAAEAPVVETPPVAAETQTTTAGSDTPEAGRANFILAEFVSRVRAAFSMQAGDGSLGFSYEFKVKLLMAGIAASAPADVGSDAQTLAHLDERLTANPA